MDTIKKIWKSKTLNELMINIPYRALEWCAFIIISIFVLNPTVKMIISLFESDIVDSLFWGYWHEYNYYILFYGIFIIILYIIKLRIDNHLEINIKVLKEHPTILLFLILGLLMILSTIVNGFPEYSILGHPYCSEGLFGHLSYIIYFFLALLCSKGHRSLFYIIFGVTSSLNILTTTFDYIFLDCHYNFVLGSTIFSNSNHYGYYILVTMIFFGMLSITSKKKIQTLLFILMYMLTLGVLLLNNTFGCQVALVVTLVFICIVFSIYKEKFVPITLLLVIAFFVTCFIGYIFSDNIHKNIDNNLSQFSNDLNALSGNEHESSTGVARKKLWEKTIEHIGQKPLLGFAADGAEKKLARETRIDGRCHNDYLHYAVCFGIPAGIIYIVANFLVFLRGLKNKTKLNNLHLVGLTCAFAYLVSAAVGNTMYYTAPLLFIMLGFGYYKTTK